MLNPTFDLGLSWGCDNLMEYKKSSDFTQLKQSKCPSNAVASYNIFGHISYFDGIISKVGPLNSYNLTRLIN